VSTSSAPELLVLHAVRVLGFASGPQVAARYRLDQREVGEHLLDEQAAGLVQRVAFADVSGWSLTEAGRLADERRLSEELGAAGCRPGVLAAAREFEAVNDRFLRAMTDWQIRPQTWDRLAANDHTDHRWDDRVWETLRACGQRLTEINDRLADSLTRFDGYATRYAASLARAQEGAAPWLDAPGRDSCHRIWIELHEDLLSTLGLGRGDPIPEA
jgi:hypothetical protein